jgi:hypothetical protein
MERIAPTEANIAEQDDSVIDIEAAREAAAQRELAKSRLRLLPPLVNELPEAA